MWPAMCSIRDASAQQNSPAATRFLVGWVMKVETANRTTPSRIRMMTMMVVMVVMVPGVVYGPPG